MSLDLAGLPGGLPLTLAADFILDPQEIEKGEAAFNSALDKCKTSDERRSMEESLDTLALVFSTGECQGKDFPWHQVRAHHGQAALSVLKEEGTPGRLEALRCKLDPNRNFRQVSESYNAKTLQQLRNILRRTQKECRSLGFLSDEEWTRATSPNKLKESSPGRIVTYGEFRAVVRVCQSQTSPTGLRDSLIHYLLYHGGLSLAELMAVSVEDLSFDDETQQVSVRTGKAKNQEERSVPLPNAALILLEDWMEARGDHVGPLFNPVKKNHRVEIKRITGAEVRTVCDKRADQAGVGRFSPDELRKSTAAQLEQSESEGAVVPSRMVIASPLYEDPASDGAPGVAQGQREMIRVCFPYWEHCAS